RIEMRQIGVRYEAKPRADYDVCCKQVCYNTQLLEKLPVSTRIAKIQRGPRSQERGRNSSAELSRLQRDLQHASLVSSSTSPLQQRDSFGYDYQSKEMDHRRQILSGTQTLEDSSAHLNNAHRIAIETENIGTNVLTEMGGQKRQLEGVRDNVKTLFPLLYSFLFTFWTAGTY